MRNVGYTLIKQVPLQVIQTNIHNLNTDVYNMFDGGKFLSSLGVDLFYLYFNKLYRSRILVKELPDSPTRTKIKTL